MSRIIDPPKPPHRCNPPARVPKETIFVCDCGREWFAFARTVTPLGNIYASWARVRPWHFRLRERIAQDAKGRDRQ